MIYNRHTVTAALPYANGPVHIGHLAGVYIPADIYVRYLRLKQEDVAFVCGSDEHGVPVTIRAEKEGISVQAVVDKYHSLIKDSFSNFGIEFDIYHRTSSEIHHETAANFFKTLYEKGLFIEKTEEQYFDTLRQTFLADRYIRGTCPKCANLDAYGDQCEKCGSTLSPTELINPRSALSDAQPEMRPTKQWYLPLNDYTNWLKTWILEGHKSDWKTNVYGQCKSWIEDGLKPRAMTRDLEWGIPVPVEEAQGKVLYVWFDAPIGYISATKALKGADWKKYWTQEDTKLVHFIGKDNIVFHCIIFPAMLKAHGEFILPENVPANEFLNLEGDKISTSRNWAVWLHEYLNDFPNQQDVLRYVLASNMPETKDNDFTWKDFQTKNNSELVAILGNFINRVIVLTEKYFDGNTPPINDLQEIDINLIATIAKTPEKIGKSIENYRFREAIFEYIELARAGNKYLQDTAPWSLYKAGFEENKIRIETILHLCIQLSANLAILGQVFLPFSSKKLGEMLGMKQGTWQQTGSTTLVATNQKIKNLGLLFEKIEDEAIQAQIDKLQATKTTNEQENTKNNIVENIIFM